MSRPEPDRSTAAGFSWAEACSRVDGDKNSLQAECGHSQGDPRSKLGEEDVERVKDGFVTFGERVGQPEVVDHIWQHGPGLHT